MAELDGAPVSADELQVLALTNYGHFTTMRVEDGRVRGLLLHLDRLVRDCRVLFDAELDPDRVRALARRVAPDRGAAIIRVTVFDPDLDLGHIGGEARPRVLVTTRPAGNLSLPPLSVGSVPFVREMAEVKSVGLFGALRHRRTMRRAGFDDALFVDARSHVSEGGTWNIGFVRAGEVVWPDAECLPGTTMRLLKDVHPFTVAPVRPAGVAEFEAAFATNAATGVRAVAAIDGRPLAGSHPMLDLLRKEYLAVPADPL
jgi:branched-subunit amino acid aminotransferase/4-amino-4-deoxychorismate lyase